MLRNTLNTFISATLIMLLGVSSSAQAMVPANSRITSTSTLTVEGLEPLTATVTVTVGLQRSKPLIVLKAGTEEEPNPSLNKWIAGKRGGENTTTELTYKYTITTEANGPATYTVKAEAAAEAVENLNKKPKVRLNNNEESITISLGATAVLEVVGNKITVPSDGNLKGSDRTTTVNGIKAGDTVVIEKTPYVVNVVDDSNGTTATITLDKAPPNDLVRGDPIAEQQEFEVALSEIGLKDTDKNQVTVTVTATQPDRPDLEVIRNQDKFTVIAPRGPKMQIYVRNLSEAEGANPDLASEEVKTKTYGVNTYFSTHDEPRHPPGSILEYLVTVRAGNEEPLTDQRYQIPEPDDLKYVLEYVAGETRLNQESIPDEGIEEGVPLSNDADQNPNVIDTDQTAYVTYQMTVLGGVGGDGEWATNLTGCSFNKESGLWNPEVDNDATKCKGVKWNADNGPRNPDGSGPMLEHNPVCWDTKRFGDGYQEGGNNPWVVGTAAEYNSEDYDCRTKCAGKSGESFGNCAADGWWNYETAKSKDCFFEGASITIGGSKFRQAFGMPAFTGRLWGHGACN